MNVGVCRVSLRLPENHTLKGKRQVIHSLCARIRRKFNVAVAEVEENHRWQLATLGITCISNDTRHVDQIISSVISFIHDARGDLEVVDYNVEIIAGF